MPSILKHNWHPFQPLSDLKAWTSSNACSHSLKCHKTQGRYEVCGYEYKVRGCRFLCNVAKQLPANTMSNHNHCPKNFKPDGYWTIVEVKAWKINFISRIQRLISAYPGHTCMIYTPHSVLNYLPTQTLVTGVGFEKCHIYIYTYTHTHTHT